MKRVNLLNTCILLTCLLGTTLPVSARPMTRRHHRDSVASRENPADLVLDRLNAAIEKHFARGGSERPFMGDDGPEHVTAVLKTLAADRRLARFMREYDVREERLVAQGSGRDFHFVSFVPQEWARVVEVYAQSLAPAR